MKDRKNAAIVILAAVIILGVVAYLIQARQKKSLLASLEQVRGELTLLEAEKRSLTVELEKEKQLRQKFGQEIAGLEQQLKERDEKLAGLSDPEHTIADLNMQVATLRSEAQALREKSLKLELELAEAKKLNADLKGNRSLAAELRKAITELKRQVGQLRRQIKAKTKDVALTGNRGFIIRDGKPTQSAKVRIEVVPAR